MHNNIEKKQEVDEDAIQDAINALKSGDMPNIYAACKEFNLTYSTLKFRYEGGLPRKLAHQKEQALSPYLEDEIVKWTIQSDKEGHGRSRSEIIDYAELLLESTGKKKNLHYSWFERFKKRHKNIHVVQGRSVSSLRIKTATPEQIKGFFRKFDLAVRQHKIPPENIFNYDECGYIMGKSKSSKVVVPSYKKRTYVQSTEGRDSCTVIESINMCGDSLTPTIIFKGGSLRSGWFYDDAPLWFYATSKNGYTTNRLSCFWLTEVFIPHIEKKNIEGKCMLIMDCHRSHTQKRFQEICKEHNIIPMYLPPHSTHILQPLDLGVFGPTKTKYKSKLRDLAELLGTDPVKQRLFISNYYEARNIKMTKERIIRSWETAGLNPEDPDKVIHSSQVIAEQIANETDKAETDTTRTPQHDETNSRPPLERWTKKQLIEYVQEDMKFHEQEREKRVAEEAKREFNKRLRTEAEKNKKPEGVSSAIPIDENKGFLHLEGPIKNYLKKPSKKGGRKALADKTNTVRGKNSYTKCTGN